MTVSVVVINDVELVVAGLVAMLEPFDRRISVVGSQAGDLRPMPAQVALVDAFGHPNAGAERIAEVVALDCYEHVILYSWNVSAAHAVRAVDLGACAVFAKTAPGATIVDDIERVVAGERIIHDFPTYGASETWLRTSDTALTAREAELLALVANGLSNREIAASMYLADSTVKTYLKRLYRKLGIHSRAQAVMRAVELGVATTSPHSSASP